MLSELHIRLFLRFSADYEHLVLTIISESIFLYDISQINNVCDNSLAKPDIFVVTHHFCLVGHYHGSTVALKLHSAAGIECICDKFRVAKKIRCVLAVQNYDLHEFHLIVEIMRLIEELCDVWLEFSVQLCELETHHQKGWSLTLVAVLAV